MRAQELFIFLQDRVDGAFYKSDEVRSWGGGIMNIQDMKASFTQDHEPLGNKRSNAQTAREIPTPTTVSLLKISYLFISWYQHLLT